MQAVWKHGYWLSDMTVECFTGKHLHWAGFIGLPLLLLTGLFVPIVTLGALLYHRKELDRLDIRLHYGFLYRPYRSTPLVKVPDCDSRKMGSIPIIRLSTCILS